MCVIFSLSPYLLSWDPGQCYLYSLLQGDNKYLTKDKTDQANKLTSNITATIRKFSNGRVHSNWGLVYQRPCVVTDCLKTRRRCPHWWQTLPDAFPTIYDSPLYNFTNSEPKLKLLDIIKKCNIVCFLSIWLVAAFMKRMISDSINQQRCLLSNHWLAGSADQHWLLLLVKSYHRWTKILDIL